MEAPSRSRRPPPGLPAQVVSESLEVTAPPQFEVGRCVPFTRTSSADLSWRGPAARAPRLPALNQASHD